MWAPLGFFIAMVGNLLNSKSVVNMLFQPTLLLGAPWTFLRTSYLNTNQIMLCFGESPQEGNQNDWRFRKNNPWEKIG